MKWQNINKINVGLMLCAFGFNVFAADLTRSDIEQSLKNADSAHIADLRRKDFRRLD
jgi:hypothetical protein